MPKSPESIAQFVDRFLNRIAMGVLIMSVAYGLDVALHFATDPLEPWLDRLQGVLALAAVIVILPTFVRFARLRAQGRCRGEPEGFIADAFRRAGSNAFSVSFVAMVVVGPLSARFQTVPTSVYVSGVLCLALAIFSLGFLHRVRDNDLDDDFETDPPE